MQIISSSRPAIKLILHRKCISLEFWNKRISREELQSRGKNRRIVKAGPVHEPVSLTSLYRHFFKERISVRFPLTRTEIARHLIFGINYFGKSELIIKFLILYITVIFAIIFFVQTDTKLLLGKPQHKYRFF